MKVTATSKPVKVEPTYDVLISGLTPKQAEFLHVVTGLIGGVDIHDGRKATSAIYDALSAQGIRSNSRDWLDDRNSYLEIKNEIRKKPTY